VAFEERSCPSTLICWSVSPHQALSNPALATRAPFHDRIFRSDRDKAGSCLNLSTFSAEDHSGEGVVKATQRLEEPVSSNSPGIEMRLMKNDALMKKDLALIEGKDKPFIVTWGERKPNWDSSLRSERIGWERALLEPTVSGASFRFVPVYLPFGRSRPFHITPNTEFIVFVLAGEMEWGVGPAPAKLERFRLGQYDTLFVPRELGYEYRNAGQTDAKCLCGFSRTGDGWPTNIIWQLPGEEQPHSHDLTAWQNKTEITPERTISSNATGSAPASSPDILLKPGRKK